MLIAATTKPNGRKLLVIGLEEGNITRLKNDEPIYKDLSHEPLVPGLEDWDIAVLGPARIWLASSLRIRSDWASPGLAFN